MNTCDTCKHYDPPNWLGGYGECELMNRWGGNDESNCYMITGEHDATMVVGPKFGCIHWIAKEPE